MNRRNLALLLVGLFLMTVGFIISFQHNQAAASISTLFTDLGFLLAFLQSFFAFPLFPIIGSPRPVPKTSSSFSRIARFALIARGGCSLLLGILGSFFFIASISASNTFLLQLLTSVGGGIVFLSGMASILIALQEWNVPRRGRWFLFEGIFGSLAGWSFMSASAIGALGGFWSISSLTPLRIALLVFSALFFLPYLVTTGLGEIIVPTGWALTTGGFLLFGAIVCFFIGAVTGVDAMAFLAFFCYPMLFGVTSILEAFNGWRSSSVEEQNIPLLFQSLQPSQKKRILMLAAVWLIIVSGTFLYSMTRIAGEQVASIVLAQQVGDPYGGSLIFSDPMNEYGGSYGLADGSENGCNFQGDGYHVSGFCPSSLPIPPQFAFEAVLATSQSCGDINLAFYGGDSLDIVGTGVCQNGSYILYDNSNSDSGSASSMHTAAGQSNLIGIVADGTNINLYINQVQIASVSDTVTDTDTGSLELGGLDANVALDANTAFLAEVDAVNSSDNREVVYTNALLWSL